MVEKESAYDKRRFWDSSRVFLIREHCFGFRSSHRTRDRDGMQLIQGDHDCTRVSRQRYPSGVSKVGLGYKLGAFFLLYKSPRSVSRCLSSLFVFSIANRNNSLLL